MVVPNRKAQVERPVGTPNKASARPAVPPAAAERALAITHIRFMREQPRLRHLARACVLDGGGGDEMQLCK